MNKAIPRVKIMLDKERTLILNFNAMVAFEEATGKNFLQLDMDKLSAKDVRAMLWACLKSDDKSLTIEQVGELLEVGNMADVASKLAETYKASMPEAKEEPSPLAVNPPNGTG